MKNAKNEITITAIYEFSISREIELPEGRSVFDIKNIDMDHALGQINGVENGTITFWDGSTQTFVFDGSDFDFGELSDNLNSEPQNVEFAVPLV